MPRDRAANVIQDLVRSGRLLADEPIVFLRRSGKEHATVLEDGNIRLARGVVCTSPSAAVDATGAPHADGWLKWRVPRLGNATLRSVRDGSEG